MRVLAVAIMTVLTAGPAFAQSASSPPSAGIAADSITRDAYIAKARDAAEKRAGKRFDAMDADHDGSLTKDEIAAYRVAHPRKKRSQREQ
jgi:hypothetical protein